jgi:allophanate hydrolase
MKDLSGLSLDVGTLLRGYRSSAFSPVEVVHEVYRRIRAVESNPIWIYLIPEEVAAGAAGSLPEPTNQTLFGIPFAVKDNIDSANLPTTAACPSYAYIAKENAAVVQQLLNEGAILIGKTNLDQFATGLVGVRSPYGTCANLFNREYICGGSSSGSALAVAAGVVSFTLGTDTAGSGRVPAAFSNVVGLKPTKGVFSTRGVVPACRSLDCVSIFALTAEDAEAVFEVAKGYDAQDPYSRRYSSRPMPSEKCRVGVPSDAQLDQVEGEYRALFTDTIKRLESLGQTIVTIDLKPFLRTAELLYGGPWVAERFAAVGRFIKDHRDSVHPVVGDIILGGEKFSAADCFNAQYQLEILRKEAATAWASMDFLLLPTAPNIYRIQEVEREPILLNSHLGTFTNFTNLLDLAGIAVPAGFRADGLPFGVTLLGPAFAEHGLLALAKLYLASVRATLGATKRPYPTAVLEKRIGPAPAAGRVSGLSEHTDAVLIAVVGAHLTGEPLNHQLTDLHGRLIERTKTAALYRLFALPATSPPKPGLVRVGPDNGSSIELEVWELPVQGFGKFVRNVPPPLTIGTVHLESGQTVKGFLCEEAGVRGATDITSFGGWKMYLKSLIAF